MEITFAQMFFMVLKAMLSIAIISATIVAIIVIAAIIYTMYEERQFYISRWARRK